MHVYTLRLHTTGSRQQDVWHAPKVGIMYMLDNIQSAAQDRGHMSTQNLNQQASDLLEVHTTLIVQV